ncbi:branched-chain amino acid ABC transporter permease [Mesorhizobium onobrychidis]|uniref:Branched-chain amino acid ABC transporter permease n=1 Tax=Mesorhizobium onobrychidis TaxID=2775404 RepID=A0ABY5QV37_9HYPH|nr:branched-chain amino acid ABC transporter permease [Mesorhizobium onobrychidis]UVC15055.1 branched-chain amino acid ABC transporter permease [Mesorhizobium onobrychidis]
MTLLFQLVWDGLAAGAIYGALALALVLIYRATHIVNFGQGEMATFSAYVAWQLEQWGLPTALAFTTAAIFSFLLGAAVFWAVVKPVYRARPESIAVLTLGLFVVFGAGCLWIWGADPRAFGDVFPQGGWTIGGVRITAAALGLVAVLGGLAVAFATLFRVTRLGLQMRAAASDSENSLLVGIRVETMLTLGWGLAAVVGFLAAALVAPRLFLSPGMMAPVLIYALAAATLGGWDSPMGAIVGGLLIGVVESVGATFISFIGADLRLAVPIVVTLVVLLVRPTGLFGTVAAVRV